MVEDKPRVWWLVLYYLGEYLKQSEVNHMVEVSFAKNVSFDLVELLDWLLNNSKGNTGILYM